MCVRVCVCVHVCVCACMFVCECVYVCVSVCIHGLSVMTIDDRATSHEQRSTRNGLPTTAPV